MTDPNPTDMTIPPEVHALLDAADDSGPYGAAFTETTVQLVDIRTKQVIREVEWAGAGQYGRNIQQATMAAFATKEVPNV